MSENGVQLYNEAYCYYTGTNGYPLNYSKAFDLFTKAAECGNSDAMNYIGIMYESGMGVLQDTPMAISWYQKAADCINAWGMYNLGRYYLVGNGVERSIEKAFELFSRAYDINPQPLISIAVGKIYYERGEYGKVYKYLVSSIKHTDDPFAHYMMGYLLVHGYTPVKDIKGRQIFAFEHFEVAAKAGMAEGMFEYGRIMFALDEKKMRTNEARKWIEKSAKMGYAPAQKFHRLLRFQSFL